MSVEYLLMQVLIDVTAGHAAVSIYTWTQTRTHTHSVTHTHTHTHNIQYPID